MQQRRRLYVCQRFVVQLSRELVEPVEEKALEMLDGLVACEVACVMQHLIEMLCSPVVTRVLRITKAIGVAVQRAWPRHSRVLLAAVHDVHQMRFHPTLYYVSMLCEAQELVAGIEDVIDELVHSQFSFVAENARVAAMLQALEQTREHPIHFNRLEVEIADFREPELPVLFLQCHQFPLEPISATSSWRAPATGPCSNRISTRPSSWRAKQ